MSVCEAMIFDITPARVIGRLSVYTANKRDPNLSEGYAPLTGRNNDQTRSRAPARRPYL